MIKYKTGDLLGANVEALVNAVNCVGVIGKGIALQFKLEYPDNFRAYAQVCKLNQLQPGILFTHPTGLHVNPRFIINFPTKQHWREPSCLGYIKIGLDSLVLEVDRLKIRSIAIPKLGCGNGGLAWDEVKPLIEVSFADHKDVSVEVYSP